MESKIDGVGADRERRLVEKWTAALGRVFEVMSGGRPELSPGPSLVDSPGPEVEWWTQSFSFGPDPAAWVGVPQETGLEIGRSVLRAAGIEEAAETEVRDSLLEVLNQAFAGFAESLNAGRTEELVCRGGLNQAGLPPDVASHAVTFRLHGQDLLLLRLAFAPAFLDDLGGRPVTSPAQTAAGDIASGLNSKTLDLLLDVELPVTVSFGRAQLPLQDVLKLTAGSIVELNRTISEPVELIVNNCVIALGEVVVVEGNYGVRIQQIASREKRLWTSSDSLLPAQFPGS